MNIDGSQRALSGSAQIPKRVVDSLSGARPWIIFFAVLCIGYTLMCIFGGCVAMFTMSQLPPEVPTVMRLMPLFYVVVAGVSAVPAYLMLRYQASLGTLKQTGDEAQFFEFAERHRQLWKVSGVLVIVFFVAMLVLMAVVFILGMSELSENLGNLPRAR